MHFVRPGLFKKAIRSQKLTVFLCGPGFNAQGFKVRNSIREHLTSFDNVEVYFGEDLSSKVLRIARSDLQTIEAQFAVKADFTILLLESPGAIAELGTFSMMDSIRPRLFVLVPAMFYEAESYIARGPLSLISAHHRSNIVYFASEDDRSLQVMADRVAALYKFARYAGGYYYTAKCLQQERLAKRYDYNYESDFASLRNKFMETIMLSAIVALDQPTFSDLLDLTGFHPDDLSSALARLYAANRIQKHQGSRYIAPQGFKDSLLDTIDTTELSRARARLKAAA